jgi:hypothetical protein
MMCRALTTRSTKMRSRTIGIAHAFLMSLPLSNVLGSMSINSLET